MKECDLIMKGGTTSGVVYPKLVTQLAKEYRFRSIGGTSAGAIAAGFAAAAEFNRQVNNGSNAGFEELDKIPKSLGGEKLLNLFEPEPEHKKSLASALNMAKKKNFGLNLSTAIAINRFRKSYKKLPNTYYGFCTGLSKDKSTNIALTDWLNENLERTAGRLIDGELPQTPLTFGMLEDEAEVELKTITTNISQGVPEMMPKIERGQLVKKIDLERLMPPNIVEYVKSMQEEGDEEFYKLPTEKDMPVLLGMRLSLSFPVLLAAFPIYKHDYSVAKYCPEKKDIPSVCWYSDGGITSNFPIHLFDNPFPTRPTFGVMLDEYDTCLYAKDDESGPGVNRLFLPIKAGQGNTVRIHGVTSTSKFLASIFRSAQNWQDATQSKLLGYKERIIRIALNEKNEGGLNLDMKGPKIDALANLGNLAGIKLREEFDFSEHKWRRVVSSYSSIESALKDVMGSYLPSDENTESMAEFLDRFLEQYGTPNQLAGSYDPDDIEKIKALKKRLDALMVLAEDWNDTSLKNNWGRNKMPDQISLKVMPNKFS